MAASKEIIYLDVNVLAGYAIQLCHLLSAHWARLAKRGLAEGTGDALATAGGELQEAVATHLEAQSSTKVQSVEVKQCRQALNEWMGLTKDAAKMALRTNKPKYAVVRHDLRIGVAYQTRRVASVLAESTAMLAGVAKHRDVLLTRMTAAEIDEGPALIADLGQRAFGRTGALNEQMQKHFERSQVVDRVLSLAKGVLDAADLEFRSAEDAPLRELFFGLDERMGTQARAAKKDDPVTPPPTPAPAPA